MRIRPFVTTALFLLSLGGPLGAAIIESVNAGAAPHPTQSWAATDVGWAYTPSLTYLLTGVDTRFRTADARTVTVEIYSGVPLNGGALLRSAGFTPLSDAFAGGSFAPLLVTAGQEIFIGFRNTAGLGANTALAADGPQSLGPDYYDFDGSGSYGSHFPFTTGDIDRPILLLNGDLQNGAVPEPATYTLVGSTLLVCCAAARRRTTID